MNLNLKNLSDSLEQVRRELNYFGANVGDIPDGILTQLRIIIRGIREEAGQAKSAVDTPEGTLLTDEQVETIRDAMKEAVEYLNPLQKEVSSPENTLHANLCQAVDILGWNEPTGSTPVTTRYHRLLPGRFGRDPAASNLSRMVSLIPTVSDVRVYFETGEGPFLSYSVPVKDMNNNKLATLDQLISAHMQDIR